ncbi:cytochrome P450 2W1 isoform X2 [Mustela nigripes]|uniref:cytochrome P450 2W1 isoform X2 n=1 Tax=Mustela nigripes TaxID=77151 RepID=UPI002815437B|nr:cytochrome P450 2W1 isoform X2 [Mustela nigripes]
MALLLLGILLLLLGLWGLLRTCTRTPSPAPRWPPGPRPLPLIGNLHLLRMSQQDRSLMELSERYGPVFTVHLGRQKTVVLAGYEAVREALVGTGPQLADRPPIAIFQLIQGGGGIFFSSGARWRAARQFTVRTLHSLGVGRGPVASKVLQELRCLMGELDGYRGQPFPLALLGWAPSNITFALLFGRRFEYQDPVFVSLLSLIDEVMVLLGTPSLQLFNIYPWLGALLRLHQPVLQKIEEVRSILRTLLEGRQPPKPRGGPVKSYMDALIQQGQGKEPQGLFAEANMVACALDMVMAGTETTSATLQWAALLMGKHPSVQGRVQAELDRVLGPGRLPRLEDQRSLPYTNAVLHEVQRFITLLPHVPRCTVADTQLGSYLLPKAAASAWGRAWPGRSCSCSLPASSTDTACCPRPASAPLPWTPRLPRPSPCGRQPRPSVWCPGPEALTQETSSDPGPSLGCSVEDGCRTNKGWTGGKPLLG